MIQLKIYALALLIFSHDVLTSATAQSYTIKSSDGRNAKINLDYKLFSKTLSVSYLKDSLFLNDYTGLVEVHVLNESFLQVVYGVRGGSGVDLRKTLILSLSKSKLNVAMLVTSYAELVAATKKSLYRLKFNLIGNDKTNYKLIVHIHDEQEFKIKAHTNYNKNQQIILNFDSGKNIFLSTHKYISKVFSVYDSRKQKTIKQYVMGILPIIQLGENSYYYIKGEWYEASLNGKLVKYFYR